MSAVDAPRNLGNGITESLRSSFVDLAALEEKEGEEVAWGDVVQLVHTSLTAGRRALWEEAEREHDAKQQNGHAEPERPRIP